MRITDEIPFWENVGRDAFPFGLHELSRSGEDRLFFPMVAGGYVLSIQASKSHASIPAAAVFPWDVSAWEVAVFDNGGRRLHETDHEMISLPREWLRYWTKGVGRFVPTPIVRVILQRFALGPEDFDRFVLDLSEPE